MWEVECFDFGFEFELWKYGVELYFGLFNLMYSLDKVVLVLVGFCIFGGDWVVLVVFGDIGWFNGEVIERLFF